MKDLIKIEQEAEEIASLARTIRACQCGEDESLKEELFDHFELLGELITRL